MRFGVMMTNLLVLAGSLFFFSILPEPLVLRMAPGDFPGSVFTSNGWGLSDGCDEGCDDGCNDGCGLGPWVPAMGKDVPSSFFRFVGSHGGGSSVVR